MKKEKISKERQQYLIIKRNDLIQTTAFCLTKAEYDMLNYIIMKIKPEDEDLYPQELVIQEYCNVMGINEKDNYRFIQDTAKGLSDKSVWAIIEEENGSIEKKVVRWIEDPVINRGRITIQIKSYWKPFLLNMEKNYTSMVLREIAAMESIYGKRTYEILKSYTMNRKGPVIVNMTIDEYKKLLFGEETYKTKYKEFANFRIKVLEVAKKDMDQYGDLKVSYKLIKEGYSYKTIQFVVEERSLDEKMKIYDNEIKAMKL